MNLGVFRRPQLLLSKLGRRFCHCWATPRCRLYVRNHFRKWCIDEEQIVQTSRGFRMRASPRDYASYGIYFFGDYDPTMSSVISCLVRDGQTAWDIGAERGWFTLLFATLVGRSGRVDAFEGLPANAAKLRTNVSLNGMSWVRTNNVAVTDRSGTMWFVPPSDEIIDHVPFLKHCSGIGYLSERYQLGAIEVATTSLDEYAEREGIRQVDVIKIDVEGAEFATLKGARKMLARCRPILVVEYNRQTAKRSGSSIEDLDELLESYGYDRFLFDRRFWRLDLSAWRQKHVVLNVYCFPRL